MTEIDLPSFLQSLHFAAAVGWDHSLSHSLAGSGLTLTMASLLPSLSRVTVFGRGLHEMN